MLQDYQCPASVCTTSARIPYSSHSSVIDLTPNVQRVLLPFYAIGGSINVQLSIPIRLDFGLSFRYPSLGKAKFIHNHKPI
jgi:hypothetical protein